MNILGYQAKTKVLLFFGAVFVFFLSFFTLFHPAIPTIPDDWYYITYTRDAIPLLPKNNPTRVLPETLMPLVSNISTLLLMPLGVGFEMSLAIGAALVLALMIMVYGYCFFVLIRKSLSLTEGTSLWITAFFILFHFLALRTKVVDNPYLLHSFCLTNYYYYTIPILLNASVIMYCMSSGILNRLSQLSYWKQGLFFLVVYISLLSNLYANILLVVYFFMVLLQDFCNRRFAVVPTIRNNRFVFAMLVFFGIILIFEANGENADALTQEQSYLGNLHHACGCFSSIWTMMNVWFKVICFVFIALAAVLSYRERKSGNHSQQSLLPKAWFFVVGLILCNAFSILISAKSRPFYVTETDKMFMEFFWLLSGLGISMAYCVKRIPKAEVVLPLLFVLLFCQTNTKNKTFKDVQYYTTMPQVNAKILDILDEANATGTDSLTLYVPRTSDKVGNWPYPTYFNTNLARTFYSHRLTRKYLKINIEIIDGLPLIASSLDYYPEVVEALNDSVSVVEEISIPEE